MLAASVSLVKRRGILSCRAIAEFSELDHFLERAVRTYSSGMYLRLGFSVATVVNPDILLIDEHLSVGDQHFRLKCKRRIMELRSAGSTIVFCSHDLHGVREVCDQALWLRDGRPHLMAETDWRVTFALTMSWLTGRR